VRKDCKWIQEDTERDYSKTEYRKNVLVFDDGGDGENSPAILFKATMCDGRSRGFEMGERIQEQLAEGRWRCGTWIQEDTELDYSQREYGKNVLVFDDGGNVENSAAILSKSTMCNGRLRGFEMVERIQEQLAEGQWWRHGIWIQEDTELDYCQREYGKNILVFDDGGNFSGDAFQGDDMRGKIAWV
jgi:hypothetical protein